MNFDPRVQLDSFQLPGLTTETWYVATNNLGTKFFTTDYTLACIWVNS